MHQKLIDNTYLFTKLFSNLEFSKQPSHPSHIASPDKQHENHWIWRSLLLFRSGKKKNKKFRRAECSHCRARGTPCLLHIGLYSISEQRKYICSSTLYSKLSEKKLNLGSGSGSGIRFQQRASILGPESASPDPKLV